MGIYKEIIPKADMLMGSMRSCLLYTSDAADD